MTISQPVAAGGGWFKFDVNVGGFEIRGCTWHPATNRLRFPRRRRYPGSNSWRTVVRPSAQFVKRLKELLKAGQLKTKRDRSPCVLTILGVQALGDGWFKLGFKVRGVRIMGCRWAPSCGSIQFPITYLASGKKKRVVHAKGAHVVRLLKALRRYAIQQGIYEERVFEFFERDIQRRREERKRLVAEPSPDGIGNPELVAKAES
jgi:hypothetical protein